MAKKSVVSEDAQRIAWGTIKMVLDFPPEQSRPIISIWFFVHNRDDHDDDKNIAVINKLAKDHYRSSRALYGNEIASRRKALLSSIAHGNESEVIASTVENVLHNIGRKRGTKAVDRFERELLDTGVGVTHMYWFLIGREVDMEDFDPNEIEMGIVDRFGKYLKRYPAGLEWIPGDGLKALE